MSVTQRGVRLYGSPSLTVERALIRSSTANHFAILRNVGIDSPTYKYYDPKTIGLACNEFLDTIFSAPDRSVFLLHACAHNPTGVDPTQEQWGQIADAMLQKGHCAFFDAAYQGFASGDLDKDAWAVREFIRRGIPLLICQSFSKNAGLYGERVGALHVVASSAEVLDNIRSQLSVLTRSEIGTPSAHGARLVALILNDPELFEQWKIDIKTMAGRIVDMRKELYRLLTEEFKTPGTWNHIIDQIGMFRSETLSSHTNNIPLNQFIWQLHWYQPRTKSGPDREGSHLPHHEW